MSVDDEQRASVPAAIEPYVGLGQFGRAYQTMLEKDAHAPGSVDRVLQERMVRLCDATAEYLYNAYTPLEVEHRPGSRPELEGILARAAATAGSAEDRLDAITGFCAGIAAAADDMPLDDLRFGGAEEQIVNRGTDWCADLARVGCVLAQIAGMPARLVWLFRVDTAYSGHAIVEAHRQGQWGCADMVHGIVYRHGDGRPASARELMRDADLVAANWPGDRGRRKAEQFRGVAIVNYAVADADGYDFTISEMTQYYRAILEQSAAGWPGGLRWLHGEDKPVD